MSQIKFLTAPGKEKINAAFVLKIYTANDYGKVILFELIDQRVVTWTFETEEERDRVYAELGDSALDAMIDDLSKKLLPLLLEEIEHARSTKGREVEPDFNFEPGIPKKPVKAKPKTKAKPAAKKK